MKSTQKSVWAYNTYANGAGISKKDVQSFMMNSKVHLHQVNACPHTVHVTTNLINQFELDIVTHSPYTPDIAMFTAFSLK